MANVTYAEVVMIAKSEASKVASILLFTNLVAWGVGVLCGVFLAK